MQKIAILTDSASDLDIEIMEKYNIKFILLSSNSNHYNKIMYNTLFRIVFKYLD